MKAINSYIDEEVCHINIKETLEEINRVVGALDEDIFGAAAYGVVETIVEIILENLEE